MPTRGRQIGVVDTTLRVRLMRERVRNTPLRSLVRSKNLVSFDTAMMQAAAKVANG